MATLRHSATAAVLVRPGPSGSISFPESESDTEFLRRNVSTASFLSEQVRKPSHGSFRDRIPYHYDRGHQGRMDPLSSRYRYYARLDPRSDVLRMPDHVVPFNFFSINPFLQEKPDAKQGSVVTIFSIWNTMMGTALLSMPWALEQAGFALGLIMILFVAVVAFYTAYRVVESPKDLGLPGGMSVEFSDVCKYFWGRSGELIAITFSIIVLLGSCIVYWVLMSNFLYHTGTVIYTSVHQNASTEMNIIRNDTLTCDVICATGQLSTVNEADTFYKVWHLQHTIPFFLVCLAFPLLNFESPTFFTKFNGLGTVSVVYLIVFVIVKGVECGIHLDFSAPLGSEGYVPLAKLTFPSLTGTLTLAYFIHNAVLSILRNQKHPENNARDLTFGFILVASTYIFIAFMLFAAFPIKKSCIGDNFLNNFADGDVLSSIARLFLLFQMLVVFPLLVYIIRAQLSWSITGKTYPGFMSTMEQVRGFDRQFSQWVSGPHQRSAEVGGGAIARPPQTSKPPAIMTGDQSFSLAEEESKPSNGLKLKWVLLCNACVIAVCIVFAVFLPTVGVILRFVGSMSGLVYIFSLPCAVHLARLKMQGRLTKVQIVIHGFLVLLGLANFIGQFLILGVKKNPEE